MIPLKKDITRFQQKITFLYLDEDPILCAKALSTTHLAEQAFVAANTISGLSERLHGNINVLYPHILYNPDYSKIPANIAPDSLEHYKFLKKYLETICSESLERLGKELPQTSMLIGLNKIEEFFNTEREKNAFFGLGGNRLLYLSTLPKEFSKYKVLTEENKLEIKRIKKRNKKAARRGRLYASMPTDNTFDTIGTLRNIYANYFAEQLVYEDSNYPSWLATYNPMYREPETVEEVHTSTWQLVREAETTLATPRWFREPINPPEDTSFDF